MPIGKNAIKRVVNNGYSKVETSAPDMENSTVEEKKSAPKKAPAKNPAPKAVTSAKKSAAGTKNPAPKAATVVEEIKKPAAKKPAAPKTVAKKAPTPVAKPAPKKSMETEPDFSPVNTAEKVIATEENIEKTYVNLGAQLPVYLL